MGYGSVQGQRGKTQREKGLGETLSLVFGDEFGLCLSLAPTSKSLIYLCEATKTTAWTLDSSGCWEGQSLATEWTGVGLVICR